MAIKTELTREQLERAADEWGLGTLQDARGMPEGSVNTLYRLETPGGWHVLRLSEGRVGAELLHETALLSFLNASRYPAVTLVPRRDGRLYGRLAERFACVFRWAPGEEVPGRLQTPEMAQESGRLMARLHLLGDGFEGRLANRYGETFARGAVEALVREARAPERPDDAELWQAVPLLAQAAATLDSMPSAPEGVIHADWFPDNIRFTGSRVSAVLDFEMACRGPFALDIATAIHAGCYDDEHVPRRAASFLSGYQSLRPIGPEERRALHAWAVFSALRFTVTRISDYHRSPLAGDRLHRKDWRRFRDRLRRTTELGSAGWLDLLGLARS